jgi:hypothetical protein
MHKFRVSLSVLESAKIVLWGKSMNSITAIWKSARKKSQIYFPEFENSLYYVSLSFLALISSPFLLESPPQSMPTIYQGLVSLLFLVNCAFPWLLNHYRFLSLFKCHKFSLCSPFSVHNPRILLYFSPSLCHPFL